MDLTISYLKQQLNIEDTYTDEDNYLQNLLDVAELSVNNYLGEGALSGYTGSTIAIEHAIYMYASHLYLTRTFISHGKPEMIPLTFQFLLDPYRNILIA